MTNSETLSPDDPFYSSKFGIEWAQGRLSEFIREMDVFREHAHDYCLIASELDADGSEKHLKFKLLKPLSSAFLGHTVDCVSSLRAALDQASFSVARLNGTLNTVSGVPYFPIRDSDVELERTAMPTIEKFLPKEISDLMRGFKPYKGGNNLIWALNKLCNTNKHGMIQPLPIARGGGFAEGVHHGGSSFKLWFEPKWDSSKNEMILVSAPVDAQFTMNYEFDIFIAFGNIEFIVRKPVIPTLHKFVDIVNRIVVAIEAETRRIGLI